MLRFRLGLSFSDLPLGPIPACKFCFSQQDPFGDHALSCHHSNLYARLNMLRDGLGEMLQRTGFRVRIDNSALPEHVSSLRPGDLAV